MLEEYYSRSKELEAKTLNVKGKTQEVIAMEQAISAEAKKGTKAFEKILKFAIEAYN